MATDKRVKLLYITTIPLTQWAFLRGQNPFMAARGFELHAASSPNRELDALARRDGAVTHAVRISRQIRPLLDLISLVKLIRICWRVRPDIVHVSTPKAAFLGALAAWVTRVPVRVFLVRGLTSENARGGLRRMSKWIEWLTAKLCHSRVFVARSLLEFARRERIVARNEGVVLANGMSNGIDVRRFDPAAVKGAVLGGLGHNGDADARPVVIGFVGRLAVDKGIEDLAGAWRTIRTEFPNTRLLLVGPWEVEDAVSATVRAELERDKRVILSGPVGDVAPYYKLMDVFAYPSHGTEGFPNAPMEAASMGLPVVAARVVGCVDAVVDGVTGTIVPPRDVGALTRALSAYLRNPQTGPAHGAAGRRRIFRDFQSQGIWEALHHEYRRLLARAGYGEAEKELRAGPAQPTVILVTPAPISLWTFFRQQAAFMRARGIDVRAVSSPGPLLDRFADESGVPVIPVAISREISPLRDLVTIGCLVQVFRRLRPRIVHAHMSKAGLLAMIAARLARVPHRLYHNHGMAVLSTRGLTRMLLVVCEALTCRLASGAYSVSPSVRDFCEGSGICPRGKMRVFGNGSINGVDAAEAFSPAKWTEERKAAMRWALNIPEDAHVVVFVGRVCRLKGLTELASAWREVREEFPSAHLLLAGEVDDRDPLPPEVMKSLKADPRVRQTGWVQDAAPVYAVADVFVLPSYHEGLPVTLLESAAMGLPAVATAIPGNTDVVTDGVTGTLVPVHDSAALAGAIGQYLRDPALGARHGRAGRARMLAEFRPHTVWDEIVAEYHRLARRGRRGR